MPETVYKNLEIKTIGDVPSMANWLRINSQRQEKAVSIAYHPKKGGGSISFGTIDEVCTLPLGGDFEEAIVGVLRATFIDQNQTTLLCRDMYQDLIDLTRFFSKKFKINEEEIFGRLAPNCVGDARSAANIIGLVANAKKQFKNSADDAYEVALYEPQYSHGIAPYYEKISLPFARLQADTTLFTDKGKKDWFISYPQLWLRVFVHFSGDPTLHWMLEQERDVLLTISETLGITVPQAESLLIWQAHNREVDAMLKRFPSVVDNLPESLPKYAMLLDKHYPTMCMSFIQMRQAYIDTRTAHTLYGRRIRPNHSPGEATAFRIFGTVEDMIAVASVSLWQNRISADVHLTQIEGAINSDQVRINGVGPTAGKDFWRKRMDEVANLGNPISVALHPSVVVVQ